MPARCLDHRLPLVLGAHAGCSGRLCKRGPVITSPDRRRLVITRLIPAKPERLFEAWTSPEHLRKWWGPPGGYCVHATVEPVVGGSYLIGNALADGTAVTISGRFTVVDPPRKLSYTWHVRPGPDRTELVTVSFTPSEGGTEVTVEHEQIPDERSRAEHTVGWIACLDRLAIHARHVSK